jgi:hypothetical protein
MAQDPTANSSAGDAPAIQIQAKLRVGAVNDPSEQEADRIAEQVMRGDEPLAVETAIIDAGGVRRKCEKCDKDEEAGRLLRKANSRAISTDARPSRPLPPNVERALADERAHGGRKLDDGMRSLMETRLAADFSRVRIHDNARAAALADMVQARAFTVDRDVFFAAGQFMPSVASGRRLLAHELVHVVQQRRVTPLGEEASLVRRVRNTTPRVPREGFVAIGRALDLVNEARRVLNDPANAGRIRDLLGPSAAAKDVAPLLKELGEQIARWKDNPGNVEYGIPEFCPSGVDAANDAGTLHLCGRFFQEYDATNDDKPLTIIHEAGHSLPGNNLFDVYDHTRLFRHLTDLPGNRAMANPDSLAGLVELLVKGGSAVTERAARAEALGYAAMPEDQVSGAPSGGAQTLIHRAIAWAEAKVDAAGTTLDVLQSLQAETVRPGAPRVKYDESNARMVFALFNADRALGDKLDVDIVTDTSGKRVAGVNFIVDELAPVRETIRTLKATLANPVKVVVDDQLKSLTVLWANAVLKLSRDLFGRRPTGPEDLAFTFMAISQFRLSTSILQAMAKNPSHVEFIDRLFPGDKRGRGVWHQELEASIGPGELVSPF